MTADADNIKGKNMCKCENSADRPCWERCEMCGDFVCNIHEGEHAADCGCPGIDWWAEYEISPYETTMKELNEILKREGLSEIPHFETASEE